MAPRSPYQQAADLVNRIEASPSKNNRTIKKFVYDKKGNLTCTPKTYALVSKVVENQALLNKLAKSISQKVEAKNHGLLMVLLYELLLGSKQSIQGGGALKRRIVEQEAGLRKILKKIEPNYDEKVQSSRQQQSKAACFPRYIRINTYERSQDDTKKIVERIQKLDVPVTADPHVPDLLVLPHSSTAAILKQLHEKENQLHTNDIILQDKSSCFSALCLVYGFPSSSESGEFEGDCLDACAAPGNKTSHLAALLSQKVLLQKSNDKQFKIYALDRDQKRFTSLQRRMNELVPHQKKSTSAVQVLPEHKDFLATKPSDYPKVQSILLDPSCSGSGIVTSTERHADDTEDADDRLEKLSGFQKTALRHAMSFPNVQRVVYSTCSLHEEENEQVIAAVLSHSESHHHHNEEEENDKAKSSLRSEWQVVGPECLSHWKRRGNPWKVAEMESNENQEGAEYITEEEASCMIRVDPSEDETNGFFVCCLQRRQQEKSNKPTTKEKKTKKISLKTEIKNVNAHLRLPEYKLGMFNELKKKTSELHNNPKSKTPDRSPKAAALTKLNSKKDVADKTTKSQNKLNKKTADKSKSLKVTDFSSTNVKGKTSSNKNTEENSKKRPLAATNDSETKASRKRAKKLEWKARQRQQKLKRLEKKKQEKE